jgi:hypothetical protein
MELVFLVMFVLVMLYRNSSQSLQQEELEDDEEQISAVLIKVEKYGDQIYFWD